MDRLEALVLENHSKFSPDLKKGINFDLYTLYWLLLLLKKNIPNCKYRIKTCNKLDLRKHVEGGIL